MTLNICYCQGGQFDYSSIPTVGILTLRVDSTEISTVLISHSCYYLVRRGGLYHRCYAEFYCPLIL